jgi:hypothetical protein
MKVFGSVASVFFLGVFFFVLCSSFCFWLFHGEGVGGWCDKLETIHWCVGSSVSVHGGGRVHERGFGPKLLLLSDLASSFGEV